MKHPLILIGPALLLLIACQSGGDHTEEAVAADSAPPAASQDPGAATAEITLEEQDARLLADRVRPFLSGTGARIEVPDARTWLVSGTASEVRLVRLMAMAFDTSLLTPEHVGRTYEIEHHDPRLLTNSARGREDWGSTWIVVATTDPTWYVMVPRDEVDDFEAVLATIDQPD